ncbi:hypothetical protein BKA70DRAFT_1228113 [Coprinopsis sp. MPI-PUGE-AT-0042]|nr:hypothetical protein BKA70DRAFT_1228113 [Coprinopsis sp. MPI-PUGE-AT-0042]
MESKWSSLPLPLPPPPSLSSSLLGSTYRIHSVQMQNGEPMDRARLKYAPSRRIVQRENAGDIWKRTQRNSHVWCGKALLTTMRGALSDVEARGGLLRLDEGRQARHQASALDIRTRPFNNHHIEEWIMFEAKDVVAVERGAVGGLKATPDDCHGTRTVRLSLDEALPGTKRSESQSYQGRVVSPERDENGLSSEGWVVVSGYPAGSEFQAMEIWNICCVLRLLH